MKNSANNINNKFISVPGEMAELIRVKDWSNTSLGNAETWPQSLLTMVSVMLDNPFGMYIAWGPDFIQLYNDGYRPILGESKHPSALGISTRETFAEIWHIIGPMFEGVMNGQAVGFPDFMLPLNRNGFVEECYFDFSYSPIRKENGEVGGVLVTVIETTSKKKAEDDLKESKDQLEFAIESTELATWDYNPATNKFTSNDRLKEWFGLKNEHEIDLQQAIQSIAAKDQDWVGREILHSLQYVSGGKYDVEFTIVHPVTLEERIVRAKGRAWFDDNKTGYRLNGTLQDITQQAKARIKLEKNEEQLRVALDGGELGTFDFFPLEAKLIWSAKTKELFGLPPDAEVNYDLYRQALHPDDRNTSQVIGHQNMMLQKGGLYDLEYRTIGITDGKLRWLRSKGVATFDANNDPIRYTGVVQEITERKEAEQALKESEERFRSLANDMAAFVFIGDGDTNVEFANRQWLEFVGLKSEEGIGKAWTTVTHPDDVANMSAIYADAVANQKSYEFEMRQLNTVGEYCWILWKGISRLTKEGRFDGMIGVGIDITDRKNAEEALHKQQAETDKLQRLYEAVTGNTPDLVYIFDLNYRFTYANPALLAMWNKTWEEAIGKNLLENGYEPWHAELHEREIDEIVSTKKSKRGTVSFPHAALGKRTYDYIFAPVLNNEGNVEAIVGTTRDITEINKAEEELHAREQQMRAMIETAPFPIGVYIGNEMKVQFANQSILDIWGKGNDVIGKSFKQILPELNNQEIFKQLEAVYTTGIPYHTKNQKIDIVTEGVTTSFYFNYSFTPLANADGKIYGVMNTAADVTDLNLAKLASQKSEENLKSTILQAPVAMCIFKGDNFIVDLANERMFEFWGKSAKEVMHKPIFEGLPEAKDQGFEAILNAVYSTGKTFSADGVPITLPRNGKIELVYVNFVYEPYREADGAVSGILAVAIDVTAQLTASKKIEQSEFRFKLALRNTSQILFTQDINLKHTWIYNHSPEFDLSAILGKDDYEIHEPENAQILTSIKKKVLDTGQPIKTELILTINEQPTFYDLLIEPIKNAEGKVEGLSGVSLNITEKVIARKKIEEREQKFRLLADSMPQLIWTGDANGNLNYFNQSVYDYSGLTEEEVKRENGWLNIVHPDDREENIKRWLNSVNTGADFKLEHRFRRYDGEYRWQLSRAKPQLDEKGNIQMWVGTSTDIQDQKVFTESLEIEVRERTKQLAQNNIELEKMNKELQAFAYISSHYLQEPLRKIQTFASLISEKENDTLSENGKNLFKRMQSSAARMQALIDDLLAYSRTQTSDADFKKVTLSSIIETVIADLDEEIQQKHARIDFNATCELNIIIFQFQQLFYNLISNSLKFSHAERPLHISINSEYIKGSSANNEKLTSETTYCHICFTDNGIGFEPRYNEKIFELFQRLHGRNEYNGTGIGLAIVKKIVENHNGMITARGQLGSGASFDIYLPSEST